eukprot:EC798141.1.p1 GENE.EC798141.1~~EC798141.1.p1  ORF type:complete len:169 (+),score=27.73 EC798141.1:30-509(+)
MEAPPYSRFNDTLTASAGGGLSSMSAPPPPVLYAQAEFKRPGKPTFAARLDPWMLLIVCIWQLIINIILWSTNVDTGSSTLSTTGFVFVILAEAVLFVVVILMTVRAARLFRKRNVSLWTILQLYLSPLCFLLASTCPFTHTIVWRSTRRVCLTIPLRC